MDDVSKLQSYKIQTGSDESFLIKGKIQQTLGAIGEVVSTFPLLLFLSSTFSFPILMSLPHWEIMTQSRSMEIISLESQSYK